MSIEDLPSTAPSLRQGRGFLVIGAEKALVIQVLLAIHAGFAGARCVAAYPRKARLLPLSNLCSSYLKIGFGGEDDDRFVDYANRLAVEMPFLLVVPADCDGARMIGRIRQRLRADVFPYPDAAMIDCFDNKWRFHQFCVQHGLNAPRSLFIDSKDHLEFGAAARELGVPFVVKPVAECASRGVAIITGEEDLRRKILGNDAYRYAPLVAQRYIRGTDVGLNLLAIGGTLKAFAVQERAYPQDEGAGIRFLSNNDLEDVAHSIVEHGRYNGVMNVDARIEEGTGRVFLLESNPRFWRSLSASVWCGLNFVAEYVESTSQPGPVRSLTSGRADTHYHPILRGSMLRGAMFGKDHRGRLARLMMGDLCTLLGQVKESFKPRGGRPDPHPLPQGEFTQRAGS